MRTRVFGLMLLVAVIATIGDLIRPLSTVVHGAGLTSVAVVFADGQGTRTTPAFNAASGDLLIAFAASDGPPASAQTLTVGGGGLTWTLVRRVNAQAGTSEIWKASASAALSNVTVTSTQASGGYQQSLTVVTFSGAGGTGASAGASAPTGAPTVSLTTTQGGSLIYGVGNDWDTATPRTPGSGQTIVHQFLAPAGDTFWVQKQDIASSASGVQVQLNDTAPTADRWNFAAVEIAPAAQPGFHVNAYNDSLALGLSDADTYNLLLSPDGDFTGAVVCDVSGLPAGVSGTFTPPGGPPHPGPFALTVATDTTVQPGTYQPIVTCVNGSLSASKTLTLAVTADPDFRVRVEPNSLTLSQGQQGVADFEVKAMNGFGQGVTLTATGLPSGASAVFTPASLIPTGAGTVQFTAGAQTVPAVYPSAIKATSMDGTLIRQAAFELTIVPGNTVGSWRQQAMGDTPALFYGAVVGDVGNTGKNRMYASGGLGVMYEYAFDGTAWSFSLMPVGVSADAEMHNMDIGPARGDGVNRLYIAVSGGDKVYECSWANANWQCPIMATLPGATDIIIGDGRNDGRTRMYVTWMAGLTEFTWTGAAWSAVTISNTEGGWVHGIDLGPGRNDGINRVYTANQGNGEVYEYSWNGTAWTKLPMGANSDSRNIELGQGRNDGTYRAYVPSGDSNVYEYTWSGTSWQKVSIGNAGAGGVKVQSIPAAAQSDGLVRIYGAASDGGVDEFTWTGSAWQTLRLGRATAYMYGLAKGDGLNKGTTQIYGASYDGQAYLFEWVPAASTDVDPPTAPTGLVATGSLGSASLTWNASSDNVGVTNYNIHRSTEAGFTVSATNRIGQSTTTSYTDTGLAAATYYYRVTAQDAAVNVSGSSNEATATVTGDTTPPTVTATTPASGATSVSTGTNVTATFNEAIDGATIGTSTFELRDPASALVPAAVTYSSATRTATLAPSAALANGATYTATVKGGPTDPRVKDVDGNALAANVAWSFTTVAASTGPTVDKLVFSDGSGTRTTASFSTTTPGDVLVAFAASDGPVGGSQSVTVSGAGLTWALVRRSNTQRGTADIWAATATTALTNVTVRSTQTATGYHQSLTVVAFAGAAGVGASASGGAASGAPSVALMTTRAGSLVYGVGNDWDRAIARTPGGGQALVHQWVDTSVGDTFWVQNVVEAFGAAGSTATINDSAPTTDRWNLAAIEILAK
jgi:fibronectin type 3 domain-containing protein